MHNSFIITEPCDQKRRKTKNAKESLPHALGRKTLDAMIRREYGGWPPNTPSGLYQPHRPEKKPAADKPKTPSK